MLKKLSTPKKEDICPNCGTACFPTDILCPNCEKNLDELFDQLPDLQESPNLFKLMPKYPPFLNWLTPLLFILSPLIVALVIALPIALNWPPTSQRSPLQFIWYVVSDTILASSNFILISAIPLFLFSTPVVRAKLGQRYSVILATIFSILSVFALWFGLQSASIMSIYSSFAFFGIEVFLGWADWVYFATAGGMLLVVLNLITVIGQDKTA